MTSTTALMRLGNLNTLANTATTAVPNRLAFNKPPKLTPYQTLTSTFTALDPAKFAQQDKEALSKHWRRAFGSELVSDCVFDAISSKTGASTQGGSDSIDKAVEVRASNQILKRILLASLH